MNEEECENPCHPDSGCPECADYWERVVAEGLWADGQWTDAGVREMLKYMGASDGE